MEPNEVLKAAAAKGPSPRRSKLLVGGVALVVAALVVATFFGVRAVNDYRADIEAMQTNAQELYDAAAEQRQLAQIAADEAQGYADAAGESVDSLVAAEAEAAAIAEAEAAAEAARAAQADAADNGPVRCPAGSSANSNDGVNDTSCFPTICFGITVPDPAHPECDVAFKP